MSKKISLKGVRPMRTESQYHDFMAREIPAEVDKKRAEELLRTLTHSNFEELWTWRGNPEVFLRKVKAGEIQHGLIPHKEINLISIYFGLHWDAGRECYV